MKRAQQQTKKRLYKVFVSYYEGGFWYPLYTEINPRRVRKVLLTAKVYDRGPLRKVVKFPGGREVVHAVLFPNGEVFDAVNEIRPRRTDYKKVERSTEDAKKVRSGDIPNHLSDIHKELRDTHRRALTHRGKVISKMYNPPAYIPNKFGRFSGLLASQVDLDD